MPFYKKKISHEDIAPVSQKFFQYLRANAICAHEATSSGQELFLCNADVRKTIFLQYANIYSFLTHSNLITAVPFDAAHLGIFINETADGPQPTVTKTHLRLPKLSHLITLIPKDFFLFLTICDAAKTSPAGDALSLNPGAAGINSIESTNISQFFTKLRTNYRLNPEYADKKWTQHTDISIVAKQSPSREAQLMAMQYLTATQNNDLLYFPMETAIDLELDTEEWLQISHDYCTPPGAVGPTDLRARS